MAYHTHPIQTLDDHHDLAISEVSSESNQIAHLMSKLRELEDQAATLREGLAHSHRLTMLGTITSIVAHEFNNLLTPIISYNQLAMINPDDKDLVQKANEKSYESATRAAHMIQSMLNFARQEDKSSHVANLEQSIQEAIDCLARDPEKDNISLHIQIPNEPLNILINPTHLNQILLNILLNARKVLLAEGGSIYIKAKVVEHYAVIEVKDTGPGIPEAIVDTLFDPFVTKVVASQADCGCLQSDGQTHKEKQYEFDGPDSIDLIDTSASRKGTGLGLHICKQLTEKAGGKICVTSEINSGAIFTITLPLAL